MNKSSTQKRHPRRTREQWQQSIAEFEQSDLSSAEFCEQRELAYSSFAKWRSVLKQDSQSDSSFIEITPSKTVPASSESDWAVELNIGDHITLRIR